jgi:release factor glutamine methyltransferase
MPAWQELLAASGLPRLEAQVLAARGAGVSRAWLLAHAGDSVAPGAEDAVRALFSRRRAGEPVAYILGEREFFGLPFTVTPDVLIPRPETELLVELARSYLPERGCLLDVGTGSGALAVAVAHLRTDADVWACDVSTRALDVARANAARHGAHVNFVAGDLFAALAGVRFNLIASNPPYVAAGDPHLALGDLRFEPKLALEAGSDGLAVIRRLADGARRHLFPDGTLVFEHGNDQGSACAALLRSLGYRQVANYNDLSGKLRVCLGHWPGAVESPQGRG